MKENRNTDTRKKQQKGNPNMLSKDVKTTSIFSNEIRVFDTFNASFYTHTTLATRKRVADMKTELLNHFFLQIVDNETARTLLSKHLHIPFSKKTPDTFTPEQKRQFVAFLLDNSNILAQEINQKVIKQQKQNEKLRQDMRAIREYRNTDQEPERS